MAKKIIVPPVDNTIDDIDIFSDKLNQILNNVEIVDNGDGTESVELSLDDRVVTFIIDQSGSMTWNDNGGFRHQIARKIIEDIEANYPGNIRYNLYQYGAIISNVLFFGIIEQDGFNPADIDSLNSLYFADDEANFAGIRVVRNVERIVDGNTLTYPTSPIDGEIVSDDVPIHSVFQLLALVYKLWTYQIFETLLILKYLHIQFFMLLDRL